MVPLRSMLVFLLLVCGQAAASEFTIDEWDLTSSVLQAWPNSVSDYFTEVTNPFNESHQVELGVSSTSASYDFAWDDEGGRFSIESQIAAELVDDSNRGSTVGWILITPSVDLAFHVDATMDFNLPRHMMKALLETRVTAYPADPPQTLHYAGPYHDSISDGIGSGTLTTCEDFIVPAGQTWRIYYNMYVDTYLYYPGGEGAIGTATGSVDISFTVLPEPSTLGLLSLSTLLLLRRKTA